MPEIINHSQNDKTRFSGGRKRQVCMWIIVECDSNCFPCCAGAHITVLWVQPLVVAAMVGMVVLPLHFLWGSCVTVKQWYSLSKSTHGGHSQLRRKGVWDPVPVCWRLRAKAWPSNPDTFVLWPLTEHPNAYQLSSDWAFFVWGWSRYVWISTHAGFPSDDFLDTQLMSLSSSLVPLSCTVLWSAYVLGKKDT